MANRPKVIEAMAIEDQTADVNKGFESVNKGFESTVSEGSGTA